MNFKTLANDIIDNIGGKGNVNSVQRCTTRLRFRLKDETLANTDNIKNLEGVIGVVSKGGQYQVVIGAKVQDAYQEVMKLIGEEVETTDDSSSSKANVFDRLLDTVSGIFVPIIPALTGTGMLQALLSLITFFKLIDTTSQTYLILNTFASASFYFLPILLASSAAKKFKCNPFIAMSIAAALLHPDFVGMVHNAKTNATGIAFLGLSVPLVNYASTVFPILLTVWIQSYIEKAVNKIIPKTMQIILVPMITILLIIPIVLVLVGPFGNYIGVYLAQLLTWLYGIVPWFVPMLIGAITPFVIMTGMHFAGLIPIAVSLLATTGFDNVIGPGMLVSNFAIGGAVFAVALKSKQIATKQIAFSSSLSSICGVSEPAIYGICLRYKRPMIATVIGGAVAGLFCGIMGVGRYAQAGNSIFSLASYIGGETLSTFYMASIGCAIAFGVGFLASYVLGIKEKDAMDEAKDRTLLPIRDEVIFAPLKGKLLALKDVSDPTFAQGLVGEGVAIVPSDGKLYAPVDGEIIMVFDQSNHALGIRSQHGAEILLHVGIDTVSLQGTYFKPLVKMGSKVKKGQVLMEFELDKIRSSGYDTTTLVVITNCNKFHKVSIVACEKVEPEQKIMNLIVE